MEQSSIHRCRAEICRAGELAELQNHRRPVMASSTRIYLARFTPFFKRAHEKFVNTKRRAAMHGIFPEQARGQRICLWPGPDLPLRTLRTCVGPPGPGGPPEMGQKKSMYKMKCNTKCKIKLGVGYTFSYLRNVRMGGPPNRLGAPRTPYGGPPEFFGFAPPPVVSL